MVAPKLNDRRPLEVLIVDDHKMVRDGLKVMLAALKKHMHFRIQEAENGAEALAKINVTSFDLIIIDYNLPGESGAETVYRILRFKPGMKVLALSNYDELPYIQRMIDAGARGYVLKNIEPPEMLQAIKTILADKKYYCNDVAIKLLDAEEDKAARKFQSEKILTRREKEILQMIAMEMTNDEIAQYLHVAKRTVDTHRQNLINKLKVRNTVGLIKVAFKLKLVEE